MNEIINQMEERGREFRAKNMPAVPVLDPHFDMDLPSALLGPALKAWLRGWHSANLAEAL